MKTAMQTLISQIETEINKGGNGAMATGFDYGLKKAKQFAEELLEMEKEQMRSDFWHHRRITGYETLKDEVKTFKQQEQ
jgi:hypothetical protein